MKIFHLTKASLLKNLIFIFLLGFVSNNLSARSVTFQKVFRSVANDRDTEDNNITITTEFGNGPYTFTDANDDAQFSGNNVNGYLTLADGTKIYGIVSRLFKSAGNVTEAFYFRQTDNVYSEASLNYAYVLVLNSYEDLSDYSTTNSRSLGTSSDRMDTSLNDYADASPQATVSVTSLSSFSACANTPSSTESFTVSASHLTDTLFINAPSGFEVSKSSGSGFTSQIFYLPVTGTVTSQTVYARMAALSSDPANDSITVVSKYANTQYVAVSGSLTPGSNVGTVTIDSDSSFCESGTFQISTSGYTGTLAWQANLGGGFYDLGGSASTVGGQNYGTVSYRVIATNGSCPSDTSEVKTIYVYSLSQAGTISGNDACANNSTTLTLSGNNGDIQWQSSTDNINFSDILGETDTNLITGNLTDTTYYRAIVTNGVCSSDTSAVKTIAIVPTSVAGTISAGESNLCAGSSTTLTLSGNTGTIQWQSSSDNETFADLTGETNTELSTGNLSDTTYYRAIVTSGICSSDTTETTIIYVDPLSSAGEISSQYDSVCVGGTTNVYLIGHTGNILWQKSTDGENFTDIVGITDDLFPTDELTVTTYYRAIVTSGICSTDTSGVKSVVVIPESVAGTITPGSESICYGTSTTLTLSGYTGTIQWQSSSDNETFTDISGETNSELTTGNLSGTAYFRAIVNSSFCSSDTAATILVSTLDSITISTDSVMVVGDTLNLEFTGTKATNTPFVSSDPTIFTIDENGQIIGLSEGQAIVTYTTIDGCTAQKTIYVNAPNNSSNDSDGDGVPDAQEILDGTDPNDPCSLIIESQTVSPSTEWNNSDCDGDGKKNSEDPVVFDFCSINSSTILPDTASVIFKLYVKNGDCDNDGILNYIEIIKTDSVQNSDGDNYPDYLDLDSDSDGILDATEKVSETENPIDTDEDGIPDYRDLDSDDDSIPDKIEAREYPNNDGINTGRYYYYYLLSCDGTHNKSARSSYPTIGYYLVDTNFCYQIVGYLNGPGFDYDLDSSNHIAISPVNTDGDPLPDYRDKDTDGDKIPDSAEAGDDPNNPVDTDGDGYPDFRDLDSDNDGIPDEKEAGNDPNNPVDTDGDGTPDFRDLDSDNDGIPDSVEAGDDPSNPVDTDGDGTPDFRDLDSDNDGIPDSVEAGDDPSNPVDTDGDGTPDFRDLDSDNDGIPDSVEAGDDPSNPVDTDGDGTPDFRDLDSDNDGIPDSVEAGDDPSNPVDTDGDGTPDFRDLDSDNDGIPDSVEAGDDPSNPVDTDGDGTPDFRDLDSDNDGIPDSVEAGDDPSNPVDTDGDGTPDFRDLDSDNDGIPDSVEAGDDPSNPVDTDGDGTPDFRDLDSDNDGIPDTIEAGDNPESPVDTDGDGTPDFRELDSDNDGIPDTIEAGDNPESPVDTDGNGTPDFRDLDSDNDGIPDTIEAGDNPANPVDTDGNGTPDFRELDSDNDGVLDSKEAGSDPQHPVDIDNDGIPDFREKNINNPTQEVDDLEIYNAITPNGDGINDFLIIRGIEQYPDNRVIVFNRWGQNIYDETGYGKANDKVFTGKNQFTGKQLPSGIYYYFVEYVKNGTKKSIKGYLYLENN